MDYENITHPFPPLYDDDSRVLILGSFPSVKSREEKFFYAHPQNRFWRVIAYLFGEKLPASIEEKKELILKNHLALWDTLYRVNITGSADSSIKNAVPTNLTPILQSSKITRIFCNGKTSHKYFQKYQSKTLKMDAFPLPSTSPANAAWTFPKLLEEWQKIREILK